MASAEDLALLATRAAANRAALSARILQHLEPHGESSRSGSASGSAAPASTSSSKSTALPKPRPPTLGLGMALPSAAAAPSAGASADARLRGTLTGGAAARSRKREREAERVELAPAGPSEAQQQQALALEAEESRSGRQEKKRKGLDIFSAKGKKKSAAAAGPIQQEQVAEASTSGAETALDPGSEAGRKAIYALAEKEALQAGRELPEGASKKAVKKARKARREQVLAEHGLGEAGQAKPAAQEANGHTAAQEANGHINGDSAASASQATPVLKGKKAKKAAAAALSANGANGANGASRALPAFPALPALQTSLPEKLLGSRFRTINEALYTTSGAAALAETTQEAERMAAYHAGFRAQTKSWPLVPVQAIARILLSASAAHEGRGMHAQQPLVLDLGAGEAPLARILAREESARFKVLSFDLDDSADGWVRRVNCAGALPLPGVSPWQQQQDETPALEMQIVDVVVFCLALMGTDWVRMISEAHRVLRTGGDLLIAEVSSRHDSIDAFVEVICALGFENLTQDSSNTHFSLFHFRKTALDRARVARLVAGDAEGEAQLESLIAMGPQVLKPCLYKRR